MGYQWQGHIFSKCITLHYPVTTIILSGTGPKTIMSKKRIYILLLQGQNFNSANELPVTIIIPTRIPCPETYCNACHIFLYFKIWEMGLQNVQKLKTYSKMSRQKNISSKCVTLHYRLILIFSWTIILPHKIDIQGCAMSKNRQKIFKYFLRQSIFSAKVLRCISTSQQLSFIHYFCGITIISMATVWAIWST